MYDTLPKDILYIIASYDYSMMRLFHRCGLKIKKKYCSYALLNYLTKYNDIELFQYCNQLYSLNEQREIEGLFDLSVIYDSVDITRFIYSHFTISNDIIYDYLLYGIQEECLDCVYYFINETNIDLETNDHQVICEAIRMNNYPLVIHLMNHDRIEDPSSQYNSPFITAIEYQNKKIFKYLLNHPKIDPHQPDNEPFKVALDMGNTWFMEKLLDNPYVSRTIQLDTEELERLYFIS